jgi:hypothetical protein
MNNFAGYLQAAVSKINVRLLVKTLETKVSRIACIWRFGLEYGKVQYEQTHKERSRLMIFQRIK